MLEFLKSAETYNIVFFFIAVAIVFGITILFIVEAIKCRREKKRIDRYLNENMEKIEYLKREIMICSNLEKFDIVKRFAKSTTENIRNDLVDISPEFGYDYGNEIIKDINKLISMREEELLHGIIL